MDFAIIETGGKQYKVVSGQALTIEKLPQAESGKEIIFDKVLLISKGGKAEIGTPYLDGVSIKAEFQSEGKGKKVTIIKFKSKSNYKKKQGHRQPFTKVKIK